MRLDSETLAFATGALAQNFVAGAALVALAWTILETGGGYEAVGIVFLVGNLTSLLVGPFVGVLVDRFDRRDSFLIGACICALSLALPAMAPTAGPAAFYLVMFVLSMGGSAQGPSLESLLQRISSLDELPQVAAVRNLLRQIGLVCGAGISGVLVATSGPQAVFALSIFAALAGGVVVRFALPSHRPAPGARRTYFADMAAGFRYLGRTDILRTGAVGVAAWSAGQMVNAALAGLAKQKGFDAQVYGAGDAFWSVGALVTALGLARYLRCSRPSERVAIAGVGGLGAMLVALSHAPDAPTILAACAGLGVFFSLAKVLADSRFIAICEKDILGRVRSNLSALSGGVGAVVYLAPTLLSLPADMMIRVWGALLVGAFVALALTRR
jgi:MFS family permease